jgi:uncharacterized protein (TIGR01777 family)
LDNSPDVAELVSTSPTNNVDQGMKIFIAGASGFIGAHLIRALSASGHELVTVSRTSKTPSPQSRTQAFVWDGRSMGEWSQALKTCEAVINLSGESLAAERWNTEIKKRFRSSRVDITSLLVDAMDDSAVHTFINASAVGYYGNIESGDVDESFPHSNDELGRLCADWEDAAFRASPKRRVVVLRIGVVLGKEGGALREMLTPFRLFVGGHPGSGRAWFPWIHVGDVVRAIEFCLSNRGVQGPVNLCSPNPVTMKSFASTLGRVIHRPSWAHPPLWVLRILLGEFAKYVVTGQKAVPAKLLKHGFVFEYPMLDGALRHLLLQ